MHRLPIKPLTINKAWRGGPRYRTKEYLAYERGASLLLPRLDIPDGELSVSYEFGLSNKVADYDNFIKAFQDILQKKYGFNDSRIYKATIRKVIVKKGEEYIKFSIKELEKEAA